MKEKLIKLQEGIPYIPGPSQYVILEEDSFEDVLRHLLSECQYDRDLLRYLLETLVTEESP